MREHIIAENDFHCHTGPSVRAAMQSRPRWPASLFVAYYRCSIEKNEKLCGPGPAQPSTRGSHAQAENPRKEEKTNQKNPHRKLHEKNRMKRSEITMEENGADGGAQNWEPKWQRLKYLFRFPETEDRNVSHLPGKRPY